MRRSEGARAHDEDMPRLFLLEPSLDDGEIVVQARRSAKVINMIQEFIHHASLLFGQGRQMSNASVEIPRITSIAGTRSV
jgi:hypothetical protein